MVQFCHKKIIVFHSKWEFLHVCEEETFTLIRQSCSDAS